MFPSKAQPSNTTSLHHQPQRHGVAICAAMAAMVPLAMAIGSLGLLFHLRSKLQLLQLRSKGVDLGISWQEKWVEYGGIIDWGAQSAPDPRAAALCVQVLESLPIRPVQRSPTASQGAVVCQ